MSFEQWMKEVDFLFACNYWGMTSDSFEDWLWHDRYKEGLRPFSAFNLWRHENDPGQY